MQTSMTLTYGTASRYIECMHCILIILRVLIICACCSQNQGHREDEMKKNIYCSLYTYYENWSHHGKVVVCKTLNIPNNNTEFTKEPDTETMFGILSRKGNINL